jgi:hypothetical protein
MRNKPPYETPPDNPLYPFVLDFLKQACDLNKETDPKEYLKSLFSFFMQFFSFDGYRVYLLDIQKEKFTPLITSDETFPDTSSDTGQKIQYFIHNDNEYFCPAMNLIEEIPDFFTQNELNSLSGLFAFVFHSCGVPKGMIQIYNYQRPLELSSEERKLLRHCFQLAGQILGFQSHSRKLKKANSMLKQELEFLISHSVKNLELKQEIQTQKEKFELQNKMLNDELELARKIQVHFLPTAPPELKNISFSYFYQPVLSIGGDFFDFVTFPKNDRIGIFISDVSGHGVPAALITGMLKTLLGTAAATKKTSTPQNFSII